jgi:hypothetical protein
VWQNRHLLGGVPALRDGGLIDGKKGGILDGIVILNPQSSF